MTTTVTPSTAATVTTAAPAVTTTAVTDPVTNPAGNDDDRYHLTAATPAVMTATTGTATTVMTTAADVTDDRVTEVVILRRAIGADGIPGSWATVAEMTVLLDEPTDAALEALVADLAAVALAAGTGYTLMISAARRAGGDPVYTEVRPLQNCSRMSSQASDRPRRRPRGRRGRNRVNHAA